MSKKQSQSLHFLRAFQSDLSQDLVIGKYRIVAIPSFS